MGADRSEIPEAALRAALSQFHQSLRGGDDHLDGEERLEWIVRRLGRSIAHLSCSFQATYAISPHAFVVGLRVQRVRPLLLDGSPPAQVAALAGFYDQAHLHRHFPRHTGTTPRRLRPPALDSLPKPPERSLGSNPWPDSSILRRDPVSCEL